MSLTVFLETFGVIFLAELGDKTQLTAMALAARYPWKKVFLGLALAFVLLNAGAVLLGEALFAFVPRVWIQLASAGLFLFFGVSTLRAAGSEETEEEGCEGKSTGRERGPILTAFLMILLAELGDKTQLMTASLAAGTASQWSVFAGSTLALWLVSLLGILVGRHLVRAIPMAWVHRAAGLMFLGFGLVLLGQLAYP